MNYSGIRYILVSLFTLIFFYANSQQDIGKGYVKPQFKGGKKEFYNYFTYPSIEREAGIEGDLTATIFVSKEGKIVYGLY